MKKYKRNANLLCLALVAALMTVSAAFADSFINQTLLAGTAAFAPTDVYRMACPAGTATVRAKLTNPNSNPAGELTVLVISPAGGIKSAISLENVAPPTAVLAGPAGVYRVAVHKGKKLIAGQYRIDLDCYTAAGAAFPGVQTVLIQNQ